jgi:hypothetical protein
MFSPYLITTTIKVIKTMRTTNQEQTFPTLSEKASSSRLSFFTVKYYSLSVIWIIIMRRYIYGFTIYTRRAQLSKGS